jgi:hypothetical protein
MLRLPCRVVPVAQALAAFCPQPSPVWWVTQHRHASAPVNTSAAVTLGTSVTEDDCLQAPERTRPDRAMPIA